MTALDDAFDARDAPHAEVAILRLERRAGHEDLAAEGHACARRWRGLGTIATLDSVRAASWISTQAHAEADDAVADGGAAHRQREGAGQGSCSDGRDRHLACVRREFNACFATRAAVVRPTVDWCRGGSEETRLEA